MKLKASVKKFFLFLFCINLAIPSFSVTETHYKTLPDWFCTSNCWMLCFQYDTYTPNSSEDYVLDVIFSFEIESSNGVYPNLLNPDLLHGINVNDPKYQGIKENSQPNNNYFAYGYYNGRLRSVKCDRGDMIVVDGEPFANVSSHCNADVDTEVDICRIKNISFDAKGTYEGKCARLKSITYKDYQRGISYTCDVDAGESFDLTSYCEEKPQILGLDFTLYDKMSKFVYLRPITDDADSKLGSFIWGGTSVHEDKKYEKYINLEDIKDTDEFYVVSQKSVCSPQDTLWFHIKRNGAKYLLSGKGYVCEGEDKSPISIPPSSKSNMSTEISFTEIPAKRIRYIDSCYTSFNWNGHTITEDGVYHAETVEHGCKVKESITVTRKQTEPTVIYDTISYYDSYDYENNGFSYKNTNYFDGSNGFVEDMVCHKSEITESGYTRDVELHILRTNKIEVTIKDSFCMGGSYTFIDTLIKTSGLYKHTYKTIKKRKTGNKEQLINIDSIVCLSLTYVDKFVSHVSEKICKGDTLQFGSERFANEGTYMIKLLSSGGCDSLVVLDLKTIPTNSDSSYVEICNGVAYRFNGYELTEPGIYKDTIVSINGCDSFSILNLKVWPSYNDTIEAETDSVYTLNGFNVKEHGFYRKIYKSIHGCDSAIVLKLNTIEHLHESICEGEKYQKFGLTLDSAGSYETTIGDETFNHIYIELSVFPNYQSVAIDTLCEGYTDDVIDMINTKKITSGSYTYIEKLTSQAGCDSVISHNLTVLPTIKFDTAVILCSDEIFNYKNKIYDSDEYIQDVSLKVGYCESHEINIQKNENPVINAVIRNDDGFHIEINKNEKSFPYKFFIDSIPFETSHIGHLSDGVHMAYVVDKFGCSDSLNFSVKGYILPMYFFSPNNDGVNDIWQIINIESFPEATVKIFTRDGTLIRTYKNYDNLINGWDGYYNGHPMGSSDYWYEIEGGGLDKTYVGHFTLIRN